VAFNRVLLFLDKKKKEEGGGVSNASERGKGEGDPRDLHFVARKSNTGRGGGESQ